MELCRLRRISIVAAALVAAVSAAAIGATTTAAAEGNSYVVRDLVSDVPATADHVDADLVNGWGLAALPGSPWWVADNGTNVSTIYKADGIQQPLVVQVPSGPTGLVSNTSSSFVVSNGTASGPALFIFATEEGKILGWNPSVSLTETQLAVDRSGAGAIYKGLAIASTPAGDFLYATDFHNGRVDFFDGSFTQVNTPGAFVDPRLHEGFAPFGIQNVGGHIFVSYAKQDRAREDDVRGRGLGFVDEFDASGTFLRRIAGRGPLNAPWGLALAPASFGRFAGDLLVGNFGNGRINAFEPRPSGKFAFRGKLRGPDGRPLAIDGLWALQFGLGAEANGPTDTLFFTAGPGDEQHGLFGTIRAG